MNFLYDFLIEFVAAFLGFLFAIVFSGINAKYEARKKLKLIINGIKNELQDIHDSLNEYIDNKVIMKHRIAIPTWDSLQFAGGVLDLLEKPYYDDLLTVYSEIKIFNEERFSMRDKEIMNELESIVKNSQTVLNAIEKENANG
ncbi:hypothetical protein [Butyrivibrio sp. AE2032]|jgi:hypothetical protein|uniref:hypothetical protein n=1 Tax=Butyrivibrio sp. AE2032 TaxID=1458463 RepID=UPI0005562025|nr:hypothetical protein [Butyrivibrio sp. AE2032]